MAMTNDSGKFRNWTIPASQIRNPKSQIGPRPGQLQSKFETSDFKISPNYLSSFVIYEPKKDKALTPKSVRKPGSRSHPLPRSGPRARSAMPGREPALTHRV